MKVKDLIEKLQALDPELDVLVEGDYDDCYDAVCLCEKTPFLRNVKKNTLFPVEQEELDAGEYDLDKNDSVIYAVWIM